MPYFIFLLFLLTNICCGFLVDPISLTVGGIGAGLGLYNFKTIKKYSYCMIPNVECCIERSIPANIDSLEKDLNNHLYGQHILIEELIPALRAHFQVQTKSRKPLVISFHGTQGTGKNFVSDFIAKHIYKYGINSKFVHKFGKADFPLESKIDEYKIFIRNKISEEVSKCPRSLFIFDEIDKVPTGIFEAITTFLDYNENIKGVEYSQAIFLFLTNTAGKEIAERLFQYMSWGAQRSSAKLHDFETILEAGVFSLTNALQGGGILEAHLIDHFIPFLPLEKQHVKECVIAEYQRHGIYPEQTSVDYIVANYVTYDPDYKLYAVAGCKRLGSKVKTDIMANYRISENQA